MQTKIPESQKTPRRTVGFRHSRQHHIVAFVKTFPTEQEAQAVADLLKSEGIKTRVLPVPPDWETR